jgi:integrase
MAWSELRRRKHVAHTRLDGRKIKGPSFDTREEADLFLRLVDLIGWQEACAYIAQPPAEPEPERPQAARSVNLRERAIAAGAIDDPVALPVTDPALPPPEGMRPAGVSVGELVRMHIRGLNSVRPPTRKQYYSYVREHMDPYFGDLDAGFVLKHDHPLAEGTCAKNVAAWVEWLTSKPKITTSSEPTDETLSPKTVKNFVCLASSAFGKAMSADFAPLVDRNPFKGMAPKQTRPDDVERVHLSPEQFQVVLERMVPHYRPFLLFLVLTGLRWGEAAGLRVCDVTVNPAQGRPYFEVRTALSRPDGGGIVFGWLKSRAARRRLTIPPALLPLLKDAMRDKDREAPVFTAPKGGPLFHENVDRNLKKAIKRAQWVDPALPKFTLHALRHTCAAWLLSAGRTPYQVSRQLGHETEATTMKYYGHLVRTEYDANADTLQRVLTKTGWSLGEAVAVAVEPTERDLQLVISLDTDQIAGDDSPDGAEAA